MATLFYMTSVVGTATSTFTTALTRRLSTSRGDVAVSQADASVATLATAANPQGTGLVAPWARAASITLAAAGTVETGATIGASLFWASEPISAVTIAGTVTANIRASESAAQANYGVGVKLYRITAAGAVSTAFAQGSNTVELGTVEGASSIALTPTSTAFLAGERIGALVFFVSAGGTSASGRTGTGFYNGPASGASGDTSLSFTEAITLNSPFIARPEAVSETAVARLAVW